MGELSGKTYLFVGLFVTVPSLLLRDRLVFFAFIGAIMILVGLIKIKMGSSSEAKIHPHKAHGPLSMHHSHPHLHQGHHHRFQQHPAYNPTTHQQAVYCPHCRTQVHPHAKYCSLCGTMLR
jgi:hypothetical protein